MITIIHGDDTATSRNFLHDIRQKKPETPVVDGEKVALTDLMQLMEGGGFFSTESTVIIEQLYSRKKSAKEFESLVSYLQTKTLDNEIYLWEGKELDKRSLNIFPHATVKTYKLPQTLFLFLDSIKPKNGKQLVKLFHQTTSATDAEMVFFMLIRQVRLLLALRERTTLPIDEVKRLAPWQQSKLQKQAALFPTDDLVKLHRKLYEIDKAMKTGELSTDLSLTIDILLLGL